MPQPVVYFVIKWYTVPQRVKTASTSGAKSSMLGRPTVMMPKSNSLKTFQQIPKWNDLEVAYFIIRGNSQTIGAPNLCAIYIIVGFSTRIF